MHSTRNRVGFLLTIALTALVSACVYDFQPTIMGQSGYVTVEGDILIGEQCSFSAHLSTRLDIENNRDTSLVCSFRVESSDGAVFPCQDGIVDLTSASPDLEYRLVMNVLSPFSRTYVSKWAPVEISPPIDSLSWSVNDDGSRMWVNVSTHSDKEAGYYRWTASETWEYHATYGVTHFFALAGTEYRGRVFKNDAIVEFEEGDNTYYCWDSAQRSDIMICSTEGLSEDRLVNLGIYAFSNADIKVSHIYCVQLSQVSLTEEAYRYWSTLKDNTTNVGGLFSPEPAEMRGNLVNIDDPDELVLGYISVTTRTHDRMFIDNYVTRFSRWRGPSYGFEYLFPEEYREYYGWQYRPAWYTESEKKWVWLPKECVDCRAFGGTKDRPSWWINQDK